MDKTTRYLLLILIITVFIVFAPLLILYVSGRGFDFGEINRNTGILDIQSDPSGAEIYLNGEKSGTTPTALRFIKEGTYTIEIRKNGLRTWSKKLFIESGKVTYAGTLNEAIHLLPNNPAIVSPLNNIDSFIIKNNLLYALSKENNLLEYNLGSEKINSENKLTTLATTLQDSGNNRFLFTKSPSGENLLINLDTKKLTTLPSQLAKAGQIEMTEDGEILGIVDGKLLASKVNSSDVTASLDQVQAFTVDHNLIYVLTSKHIQTFLWDGTKLVLQSTLLEQDLPNAKQYQLFLTNQKELFLLADKAFFRVNSQFDLINGQTEFVSLDKAHQLLTFQTPSEVFYYNFLSARAELLSRVTSPLTYSVVIPNLGYGFTAGTDGLKAIEIDNRNGQNIYSLLEDKNIQKILISPKEDQIIYLVNDTIFTQAIRK